MCTTVQDSVKIVKDSQGAKSERNTRTRRESKLPAGYLLDLFAPVIIVYFILHAWYWSAVQIGVKYLILAERRSYIGALYVFTTGCLFFLMIGLHLSIVFSRYRRGAQEIPISSNPDVSLLIEPYECVSVLGELRVCTKSGAPCEGKWKSPRTHHCSTCGICRPGLDHHCPWVGTCVTHSLLPSFLLLLALPPILMTLCIFPITTILRDRAIQALLVSLETRWIKDKWWDKWYSWCLVGGPPGRWIVGTVLGLRELRKNEMMSGSDEEIGSAVRRPGINLLLTVLLAALLSIFACMMYIVTIRNILQGRTTVESYYTTTKPGGNNRYSRYLCVPSSSEGGRMVYKVLPDENLYDLGWRENLKIFAQSVFRGDGRNDPFIWPKINPEVLRRCRDIQKRQS